MVEPIAEAALFRRLTAEDLQAVLELERAAFPTPWNEEQFQLAFTREIFHVFGLFQRDEAGRESELLAYAAFYHAAGEMEILNIAVTPLARRRGLGKRLLNLALSIGARLGAEVCFLEVRESNLAARTLYAHAGFTQVGRRPGYYKDTGEDALVLSKGLAAPKMA